MDKSFKYIGLYVQKNKIYIYDSKQFKLLDRIYFHNHWRHLYAVFVYLPSNRVTRTPDPIR